MVMSPRVPRLTSLKIKEQAPLPSLPSNTARRRQAASAGTDTYWSGGGETQTNRLPEVPGEQAVSATLAPSHQLRRVPRQLGLGAVPLGPSPP